MVVGGGGGTHARSPPLEVHHLEDLVTTAGTAALTENVVSSKAQVPPAVAKVYSRWVAAHSTLLKTLRPTDEPLWSTGLSTWEPVVSDAPSITVVGGRGAKRKKVRMVPLVASLLEIDEDLRHAIGGCAAHLLLICSPDPGDPPSGHPPS